MATEELEIHVDDIGTSFEVTLKDSNGAVFPIDAATTKDLLFRKPDDSVLTKAGVFVTDGLDGKLKYVSISGDLNQPGDWVLQAYIVKPGFDGHSSQSNFEVFSNL